MKKYLFAMLAASVLILAIVGVASANGGPHGSYTMTTDACAGCHRTHSAVGPKLLVQNTTFALCMSCHGTAGTGADTNVQDGLFLSTRGPSTTGTANTADNAPLLGGGFSFYKGAAVTSTHDVSGTALAAWGNGVNRAVTGSLGVGNELDCASCHDPHGSTNYRIFNTTINGVAVAVAQVDEAAKDYDTEQWGAGQSSFCAACHNAYHKTAAGQGSTLDNGTYTHRVDMANAPAVETVGFGGYTLPLGETGTQNRVVCQTCHLPHGSSSAMSGYANGGPTGAGTLPGNTTATDSALLRLDNRGVCEVCHQK